MSYRTALITCSVLGMGNPVTLSFIPPSQHAIPNGLANQNTRRANEKLTLEKSERHRGIDTGQLFQANNHSLITLSFDLSLICPSLLERTK